jgi:riboflavin synthase
MFTGLVHSRGSVARIDSGAEQKTFVIESTLAEADLAVGASVCTSGVCLTVTSREGSTFTVEAAFETLKLTTLGALETGDPVNLEASLRVGDAIGGHLVSGHVDGIGTLLSVEGRGDAREMWFEVPTTLAPFIAAKGSVCIDGVSLTINQVEGTRFMIGVIPHTLEVTTLGTRVAGDNVNIEVDQLARYVARILDYAQPRPKQGETD